MRKYLTVFLLIGLLVLPGEQKADSATPKTHNFVAEIWVDNWFALYVSGKKIGEDSVPFSTERSFNSEKLFFKASFPFTVGVIARDFIENESGLEYIGKPNQQIGDGGIILQIRELSTGNVVAATNKSWKVFVTNRAPINEECVKSSNPKQDCENYIVKNPVSWSSAKFKDSNWKYATEFTEQQVGVKDGYFNFEWSPKARLIWSSDLRIDNTVLLRSTVLAPKK